MIRHPYLLVVFLLIVESAVLYISARKDCQKYFKFLPPVFWIYFLPMLASTFNLIDREAEVYKTITTLFLPAALVLLLLSSDIRAILRLGPTALVMMAAGAVGIMAGMPLVFSLVQGWVGAEMWSGFGALSGSWIGGSANMIAVKEAVGTPEAVYAPMVIVDTIVPYVWMGLLVILSGQQERFDRWNRSDRRLLEDLSRRVENSARGIVHRWDWRFFLMIILISAGGSYAARTVSEHLPVIKDILSTYAWTVMVASVLGLALSFSPARRLEQYGASKIGYFILYFVLTAIGAKSSITNIGSTMILICAGFLVVVVHAVVLLTAARILRAPMFLVAAASQANIGGVASAPVVAAVYQPGLASVGLLLAILGNIVGTYLGIITAQMCRWVS